MANKKLLIFGLDGATFDLITPLIEEGALPNIKRILDGGASGNLRSTIHPLTPQAWTSFSTGKNAGKHGIYDFKARQKGSYHFEFLSGSFRSGKTVWKILSEASMKVGVLNVPFTYPVEEVNGLMIPGFDAPRCDKNYSFPDGIHEEIVSKVGRYEFKGTFGIAEDKRQFDRDFLAGVIANRADVTNYLLKEKELDLYMMVFNEIDHMQHIFWMEMDELAAGDTSPRTKQFGNMIRDAYTMTDQALGKILESVSDDTYIMLISDHGARRIKKLVFLNRLLADHGLLIFKDNKGKPGLGPTIMRSFKSFLKKHTDIATLHRIRGKFRSLAGKIDTFTNYGEIDWEKSQAYSHGLFGNISINLAGREPKGIVSENDHHKMVLKIKSILEDLRDPDTGEKAVAKVHLRDDLFHGNNTENAPDILIEWVDYAYFCKAKSDVSEQGVFSKEDHEVQGPYLHSGTHHLNGIFALSGPGIKSGSKIDNAQIIDVAPTILYLFDQPVPGDMDGKVLTDLFSEDYLAEHSLEKRDVGAGDDDSDRDKKHNTYNSDEEEEIRARLSGLGYLE